MSLTMAPILLHSDGVPTQARAALRAALYGPPERREAELESAARLLFRAGGLECHEARDLVGLPPTARC